MKKGSITPFCALCLMMIASVLFVLLESARVYGLDYYASLKAEALMDSLCAEYQPLLWEQYGVLALDGAYGTEYFSENYMTEKLLELDSMQQAKADNILVHKGLDLFRLSLIEAELKGYALATDEQGKLFSKYIAERMKEELPVGIAANIYEKYQMKETVQTNNSDYAVKEAVETLQRAEWEKWNEIEGKIENAETEEEEESALSERWVFSSSRVKNLKNMLENVSELKSRGVLTMILGEEAYISDKFSKPEIYMADREKKEGTIYYTGDSDWYQKILVLEYLDKYFSSYTEERDGHYLDYEMEYVLAGKDVEWRNLESVFQKLLLVREVANITYLLKNPERMQQAENLARGIALLVGENPAVIKGIQIGVVAAWAYAESILDVRALVSGEVIPILKTDENWTLDILDVIGVFELNKKAKLCKEGMDYREYIKLLLVTENNETIAYRMMEVMEMSLQKVPDYKNCKMNQMYLAVQYKFHFESNSIFSSLITIGTPMKKGVHFWKEEVRSYIP